MKEKEIIKSIEKVELKEDELLLFKYENNIPKQVLENFRDKLYEKIPFLKNRIIFIGADSQVVKVTIQKPTEEIKFQIKNIFKK